MKKVEMMDYKSKKELGIGDNRNVEISKIKGISVRNFRNMQNQKFVLSDYITVVSGRNGTMKSTIMGLVAHPYNTDFKDVFNNSLKTQLKNVFKFSGKTDLEKYEYNLNLEIIYKNQKELLSEPVSVYPAKDSKNGKYQRHRVVVSGNQSGDGNFSLPSTYINLKRLFPLVETDISKNTKVTYTDEEKEFISSFFERVLLKKEYSDFDAFDATSTGAVLKQPIGPKNASYDINSISSGEDNLGTIVNILVSYMRLFDEDRNRGQNKRLTGLISIDEFEASLHPISQLNLFNFLLNWSQQYNVQIIINTHSLFLIDEVLKMEDLIKKNKLAINFITSAYEKNLEIWHNPSYKNAKRELTLRDEEREVLSKIKVLCEDKVAESLIKDMVGKDVAKRCLFQSDLSPEKNGTSWMVLDRLATNASALLKDSMAMIVYDGDVSDKKLSNRNFDKILRIPTISNPGFAFEKELVVFILSKQVDDNFFKEVGKSKSLFDQKFTECGINLSKPEKSDIKSCKKWYQSIDGRVMGKYRRLFIKENDEMATVFKSDFVEKMNSILVENGFPKLDLEEK